MSPKSTNPDGLYEDREIVQLHERILNANNAKWYDYAILRQGVSVPPQYRAEAVRLFKRKFHRQPMWGWKDPRSSLFLAFWHEIFPKAKFVFAYRRPEEVVWSLVRRGDFKIYYKSKVSQAVAALRLWEFYNRQIVEFACQHRDSVWLTLIPDDVVSQEVLAVADKVFRREWAFALEDVKAHASKTYKSSLMQHKVPRWIRALTKAHLSAAGTFHRLNRLHGELLIRSQANTNPHNPRRQLRQHERAGPVVCVIHQHRFAYSETFIQAQIEHLPATIRVLYGVPFPKYRDDGTALLDPNSALRIMRAAWRRILRLPSNHFRQAALKHFLQANRVDAVLAAYGPVGVAVMDACGEASVPLIVYFRGYDAYSRRILDRAGRRYAELFENAAAIFVVSRAMERHLRLDLGAPQQKMHLNPDGVDTSIFHGADPAQAPPVFVAVGRFVDKKAPHLTLLAFKQVVSSVPNARLVMIGDGPLWEACQQIARAEGISGAVEFLGPRAHSEVAAIMRGARAFVQHSITPSYEDAEGTPNAIKEAGATGLPVVSTRHTGIPEIVIEGKTGFLVDEGDLRGMAEHMARLAKDPDLAARLGRAAREFVCAEFSMQRSIDSLTRVVEAVIRDHRANSHPPGRSMGIGHLMSWFGR